MVWKFLATTFAVTALDNPCKDQTNCFDCINPNHEHFCGWCSPEPTVYNNGTIGSRCQDHRENSWHCNHIYSTDKCKQGYVCNATSGTCHLGKSGEGDLKEICEAACHKTPPTPPAPHTLSFCNTSKKTPVCESCQDYCKTDADCPNSYCLNGLCHGSKCQSNSTCGEKCSTDTPDEILGIWRGIMINKGYQMGEYDFEFRKRADGPQVIFVPPTGPPSTGNIEVDTDSGGKDVSVTYISGPYSGVTYMGAYSSWEPSHETETMAFFFGEPNAEAPATIETAMAGQGSTVFVMSRCSSKAAPGTCNFTSVIPPMFRKVTNSYETKRRADNPPSPSPPIHDPCNVFDTCTECTGSTSPSGISLCGWCSKPVEYHNQSTGRKCAGFDSSGNPLGWVCHGTFNKGACADYGCDFSDIQHPKCKVCNDSSCTQTKEQCNSTCVPPPQQFKCDNATKSCVPCKSSFCTKNADCPGSYCHIHGPGPWTCHGGNDCQSNSTCNTTCHTHNNASHYKCEPFSGQCKVSNASTPGSTTQYECEHECTAAAPKGTWRGIQVSKDFERGEWDFTFYENSTLHWRNPAGTVFQARVIGFNVTEVAKLMQITGEITSTGEHFQGIYRIDDQGDDGVVDMLFWGQGPKKMDSFNDAMTQSLLVLQGCRGSEANCDFTSSIVSISGPFETAVAYATTYLTDEI